MTKEQLGKLITEAALLKGEFTLRSGRKSNYYFDKYLFETKPEVLRPLTKELAKLLPPLDSFNRLGGPELGAVALTAALLWKLTSRSSSSAKRKSFTAQAR